MGIVTQYAQYRSKCKDLLFQICVIHNDPLHLKPEQVFHNRCRHLNCWGLIQAGNEVYVFKLTVLCPWKVCQHHGPRIKFIPFFARLPLVSSEYSTKGTITTGRPRAASFNLWHDMFLSSYKNVQVGWNTFGSVSLPRWSPTKMVTTSLLVILWISKSPHDIC